MLFHYVGLKKRWTMAMLIDAVHASNATSVVFQKKLRIEAHDPLPQWSVREVQIFSGQNCGAATSLAKVRALHAKARARCCVRAL